MIADTNRDKGRTGLAMAIAYYGTNGYTVSIPLNDTQDYDLIVDKNNLLQKVQVKCTGYQVDSGAYSCLLKSCGGTNGTVYKRLIDTDVDILFVVCTNGWLFEIPKKEISQRSTLSVKNTGSKYSKYLVSLDSEVQTPINHTKQSGARPENIPSILKTPKSTTSNIKINDGKGLDMETLKELLRNNTSFTHIGKVLGVTDNAVRKWCRKYGLPAKRAELILWQSTETN